MRQEMTGFWDTVAAAGLYANRKPHQHLYFTGWVLFLTPNQQCQSTKGKLIEIAGNNSRKSNNNNSAITCTHVFKIQQVQQITVKNTFKVYNY